MKFDELNKLRDYFSIMDISDSEKKKRVSIGKMLYDTFSYVFTLMWTDSLLNEDLDREFYIDILIGRLMDELDAEDILYEEAYIRQMVEDIIDTTVENFGDEEYFSDDRSLLIAQNEACSIQNYNDFIEAKAEGKKYKVWLAELDERTRPWHRDVDYTRIPIDDMFHVGDDYMRFPHDYQNASAKNLVNCRCECRYE